MAQEKEEHIHLKITKDQAIQLYKLKRFFQESQGVHYFDSTYQQINARAFLQDVINYACWYWGMWDEMCIETIFARFKDILPSDWPTDEREHLVKKPCSKCKKEKEDVRMRTVGKWFCQSCYSEEYPKR